MGFESHHAQTCERRKCHLRQGSLAYLYPWNWCARLPKAWKYHYNLPRIPQFSSECDQLDLPCLQAHELSLQGLKSVKYN